MTKAYPCPVKGCATTWANPPPVNRADAAGVARALGMPAEAFAATHDHQAQVRLEHEMQEHLDKHTTLEWIETAHAQLDLLRTLTMAVSRHACEPIDRALVEALRPALDYFRDLDTRAITALAATDAG